MRTRKPDRPSLELDDCSGPFQPDLHLSDFSKEGLMKLVEIGGSITGSSRGIGRSVARTLAAAGAAGVIDGRDASVVEEAG
jgi:hypothetical protein